jgi:sugar phosphate isomerase/epimerase
MSYPALQRGYRGVYPFRIGTTSYIYPDSYVPNVEMLGPYLDEIELLFFESSPADHLPSRETIGELKGLSEAFGLRYNVHLPTDISLCDQDPLRREEAVDVMRHVIDLTTPLSPTTLILHLPYNEDTCGEENRVRWLARIHKSVDRLTASGIKGTSISVETLAYPIGWLETVIRDFHLSLCMDMGHMLVQGHDMKALFDTYPEEISMIHLHGVENGKDHLALDRLTKEEMDRVIEILGRFSGIVSLEVFSFRDLEISLNVLEQHFPSIKQGNSSATKTQRHEE